MTTILLDTHAYVWAVSAPDHLSVTARSLIEDATSNVLVSAASVWEMAIKHRAGRWPEAEVLLRAHDETCARLGARQIPIASGDAIAAGGMAWEHRDPFDRMLAAQAIRQQCALITRDAAFVGLAGLAVAW